MGGDGGTISSNRTYLRGAGKACHTADHPSNALKRAKLEDAERAKLVLTTCAISGAVLDLSPAKKGSTVSGLDIVACPYGKLYKREKALEALLYRSQTGGGGNDDSALLGSHIRGMKDLHPVRFHVTKSSSSNATNGDNNNGKGEHYAPSCPITGSEMESGNVPCFLIVRTKKSKDKKKNTEEDANDEVESNPNVLSERAIKEMGVNGLQAEYGPFVEEDMIRLAPPKTGGVFDEIQKRWEARMEEERVAKLKKKKDKKRKKGASTEDNASNPKKQHASPTVERPVKHINGNHGGNNGKGKAQVITKKSAVDEARSTVQSAVSQNAVLSDLFGTGKKKSAQTEKEKRDALFTRNC